MAGFSLANAGLVERGMTSGQEDTNTLETQKQNLEAGGQQNVLRGQQIQSGAMGLEDLTRQYGTEKAAREAASGAAGQGPNASFDAMAKAYEAAGNPMAAQKVREAQRTLIQEGMHDVIHGVMMNDSPGPRPDLAEIFNRYGKSKVDPAQTSLEKSPDGDMVIKYMDANGQQGTLPVGRTAMLLGMIKAPTVHPIAPGGALGVVGAGGGVNVVAGPPEKSHPLNTNFKERTFKDAEGNERQEIVDLRTNQVVAPGEAGTTMGTPTIRKDLPALKAVEEVVKMIPGATQKNNPDNPLDTNYTLTPKGQALLPIAQRLYQANKNLSPGLVADMVEKGQINADKTKVRYNGKVYKLAEEGAVETPTAPVTPLQTPAPVRRTAPPAQATVKPPVAPAKQPQGPEGESPATALLRKSGIFTGGTTRTISLRPEYMNRNRMGLAEQ